VKAKTTDSKPIALSIRMPVTGWEYIDLQVKLSRPDAKRVRFTVMWFKKPTKKTWTVEIGKWPAVKAVDHTDEQYAVMKRRANFQFWDDGSCQQGPITRAACDALNRLLMGLPAPYHRTGDAKPLPKRYLIMLRDKVLSSRTTMAMASKDFSRLKKKYYNVTSFVKEGDTVRLYNREEIAEWRQIHQPSKDGHHA